MRPLHFSSLLCLLIAATLLAIVPVDSWISSQHPHHRDTSSRSSSRRATRRLSMSTTDSNSNLHGQNSCFMPLKQLDQDYYAPRIIHVAGTFPGITKQEILATPPSEPSPDQGQWSYDFCTSLQVGKVAVEGSQIVHAVQDPVIVIAEHSSLNIPLPKELTSVDLIVLVDRSNRRFGERKFLLTYTATDGVVIGAYNTKADLPPDCEILGQVAMVQVPWLPAMQPTKSGFMEVDEYF
ncbi:hypothetical protein MPSEU_000364500 [Mayamaea pseudoterrestris]|nr:hypothetical protein MPSEU_000364500 [Mayamaea pseudoterrestris]